MSKSVNQAQFAKIIDVDRAYVTRLKKQGRLVLDGDGRVLVEESKRRIKETADPNRDDVRQRWQGERTDSPEKRSGQRTEQGADDNDPDGALDTVENHDYQRARAKKEHFLAERARLDYQREIGELVPMADMRLAVADVVTTFRQALEQLPYRTGPDLVGKDLDAIRAILRQDIRAALSDMEREFTKRLSEQTGE